MTQVNTADGPIATDLPADAVADLEVKPEGEPAKDAPAAKEEQPEEGKQPDANKAVDSDPKADKPRNEDPKVEPAVQVKPKKAGPIADLLEKKHQLEADLESERKEKADLQAKLQKLSEQPASPEATDKIKALAEKYGLEPEVLSDIVTLARDGLSPNPQLPKEVADLIAERNLEKAQEAEIKAFDNRVERLSKLFPDEPIKANREKLMALAYSDEKAPDGEAWSAKELSEIYFFGHIKPEVEPGKSSGEANATGGTRAASPILDYEELLNDEDKMQEFAQNSTSEEWAKFTKWRDARQGDVPIRNKKT